MAAANICQAQVPSDCTVPQELATVYESDIKDMAVRRMYQLQSPDTAYISIPQSWTDPIAEGLAAIFNATSIPERDTIFNLYCVHDNTSPMQIYNEIMMRVDTSYPWTDEWQNLNPITGNAIIDALVMKYDLSVSDFYYWSIGDYAILQTDSFLNIYALMDSLKQVPGIISGEPNSIIGNAGQIIYSYSGGTRYYDFYFEFNDCIAGCSNYRMWKYKVNTDCSVEYLGYIEGGWPGIPFPPPLNCNVFPPITNIPENNQNQLQAYPNPTSGILTIEGLAGKIELYNSWGTLIQTSMGNTLDLSPVAKGIYIVRILDEQGRVYSSKVVKE
jgi:hypothetical protein